MVGLLSCRLLGGSDLLDFLVHTAFASCPTAASPEWVPDLLGRHGPAAACISGDREATPRDKVKEPKSRPSGF